MDDSRPKEIREKTKLTKRVSRVKKSSHNGGKCVLAGVAFESAAQSPPLSTLSLSFSLLSFANISRRSQQSLPENVISNAVISRDHNTDGSSSQMSWGAETSGGGGGQQRHISPLGDREKYSGRLF